MKYYHFINLNLSQKLSVSIINLNEEATMQAFLVDLGFADEIIIVDSYSTDKTKSIAQSFSSVTFIQKHSKIIHRNGILRFLKQKMIGFYFWMLTKDILQH